jgi:hypothetical protein
MVSRLDLVAQRRPLQNAIAGISGRCRVTARSNGIDLGWGGEFAGFQIALDGCEIVIAMRRAEP